MGIFYELFALYTGSENFCWCHYNDNKLGLLEIPTQLKFKVLPVIYFQNTCMVTCDFNSKNKCFPLHFKRCLYCCSAIKLLELINSIIACIITFPYNGLLNGMSLINSIKYS